MKILAKIEIEDIKKIYATIKLLNQQDIGRWCAFKKDIVDSYELNIIYRDGSMLDIFKKVPKNGKIKIFKFLSNFNNE